jgi:succinylglutamate desuccinylase
MPIWSDSFDQVTVSMIEENIPDPPVDIVTDRGFSSLGYKDTNKSCRLLLPLHCTTHASTMVQTQEVLQRQQQSKGQQLEDLSDAIDEVNIIKGKQSTTSASYDQESKFDSEKDKDNFRDYEAACDRVKNFYAEQHAKQTLAYNLEARKQFRENVRARMGVWEAIEKLNTLIDESDPDTELSQIQHLLQVSSTTEVSLKDVR